MRIFDSVKNWFTLTQKKFRDRKDFRYIKCPVCKAQLRVKNKKGNHVVRCPRCGSEFDKKIQSIKLKRTGDNKTLVRVLV